MAEVKTELLCTIKVIPAPTRIARYPVTHANGKGKSAKRNLMLLKPREHAWVRKTSDDGYFKKKTSRSHRIIQRTQIIHIPL